MTFRPTIRFVLLVFAAIAYTTHAAKADPVITYDQTSGNLAIVTDGWWKGFNYKDGAAVRFTSISGALTAPSNRPNPPVIVDTEDLPGMLTIIFIPSGTLSLLDAVAIGTPLSDLTAEFAPNFSWPIAKVPIGVPEPSAGLVAGLSSLLSLAALRRRK